MKSLKSAIAILALSLSACSAASVGSQDGALNGHTAVVDADTTSVVLSVDPALADTLPAQNEIRSLSPLVRLEVISPEGCVVHEATAESLRSGQSALREAFLELDPSVREALLQDLPEHREELANLDSDAP